MKKRTNGWFSREAREGKTAVTVRCAECKEAHQIGEIETHEYMIYWQDPESFHFTCRLCIHAKNAKRVSV